MVGIERETKIDILRSNSSVKVIKKRSTQLFKIKMAIYGHQWERKLRTVVCKRLISTVDMK